MRHARHPEKEQRRRRGRFYPIAQSAAWSELLTAPERDRREENASCCDPDKGPTERQGVRSQGQPPAPRLRRAKEGREQRAEVRSNDSITIWIHSRLFRAALRYPRG